MTKNDNALMLSSKECTKALSESDGAKKELACLIYDSYCSQRIYGRTPQELKGMTKNFRVVLEDYNLLEIRNAFKSFLGSSPEMPTPSDIKILCDEARKEAQRAEEVIDWREEQKRKDELYGTN